MGIAISGHERHVQEYTGKAINDGVSLTNVPRRTATYDVVSACVSFAVG